MALEAAGVDQQREKRSSLFAILIGKVFERLIRGKLAKAIRVIGDLSPRQFGFGAGRSTLDAVMEVGGCGSTN